jgi:RNA polymerase sigma factor (sigma-70 family)
MVFQVCRRRLHHWQDAEDAFQATFLVLARKASAIRRPDLLANWLYGVALRTTLKARASGFRRGQREAHVADLEDTPAPADAPWQSLAPVLDEEVNRLPVKYRTPVVLCYLEGMTNEEAARRLGCAKGTLQSRLAWARRRLCSRLTARGLTFSAGFLATLLPRNAEAVPVALANQTVDCALAFGGWKSAAAGALTARSALLAGGVLHAMLLTKLKIAAFALLLFILLGVPAGFWLRPAPAAEAPPIVAAPAIAVAAATPDQSEPAPKKTAAPKTDRFTAKDVVKERWQTGATPRVVVDVFNGSIHIKAKADNEVTLELTKEARAKTQEAADKALKEMNVHITKTGETVSVVAKREEEKQRDVSCSASAELQVPAGATLDLHTSNGGLTIDDVRGPIDGRTSNGAVWVSNNKGPLHVTTSNGKLVVKRGAGKMELKTSNGPIEVEGDRVAVTAQTSNGSVQFHGALVEGAHTFTTSNGGVHLTLPKDAEFSLDATTSHGSIRTGFSLKREAGSGRTHVKGTVGDHPSTSLKLRSSNGGISIDPQK